MQCGGYLRGGLQNAMQSIHRFAESVPTPGDCYRHVVVVTFVLRSRQTNVRFELQKLEGGVRVTGLLCLLGVGIGLGTIVIYKLYATFFPRRQLTVPVDNATPSKIQRPNSAEIRTSNPTSPVTKHGLKSQPLTPDSGISPSPNAVTPSNDRNLPSEILHTSSSPGRLKRSYSSCEPLADQSRSTSPPPRRCHIEDWLSLTDHRTRQVYGEPGYTDDNTSDIYANGGRSDEMGALDGGYPSCRSSGFLSAGHGTDYISIDQRSGAEGCRESSVESEGLLSERVGRSLLIDGMKEVESSIGRDKQHGMSPSHRYALACLGADDFVINTAALLEDSHLFDPSQPLPAPLLTRPYSSGSLRRGLQLLQLPLDEGAGGISRRRIAHPRRRRFSFSSQTSGGSSGYTYRESLVSKGFSVDGGEDLEGMLTPPEVEEGQDGANGGDMGTGGSTDMDLLHNELRQIQRDIDEMNQKVEGLQARENLSLYYTITATMNPAVPLTRSTDRNDDSPMWRRHHDRSTTWSATSRGSRRSRSLSPSPLSTSWCQEHADGCSPSDIDVDDPHGGLIGEEFMWDYHSDLALDLCTTDQQSGFVACRPVISGDWNMGDREGYEEEEMEGVVMVRGRRNSSGAGGGDLYIDDDFGEMDVDGEGKENMDCSVDDSLFNGVSFTVDSITASDSFQLKQSGQYDSPHHGPSQSLHTVWDAHHSSVGVGDCAMQRLRSGCSSASSSEASSRLKVAASGFVLNAVPQHVLESRSRDLRNNRDVTLPSTSMNRSFSSLQAEDYSVGQTATPSVSSITRGTSMSPSRSCPSCCSYKQADRVLQDSSNQQSMSTMNAPPQSQLCPVVVGWEVENIGMKRSVYERFEQCDNVPHSIKKGYRHLLQLCNQSHVRQVRADLYSSLRAIVFQAMLNRHPILNDTLGLDQCYQKLSQCMSWRYTCINGWNFANRLPFSKDSVQMKLAECLHALFQQVDTVSRISSYAAREQYLVSLFNEDPNTDLRLLEAVKILMILKAASFYEQFSSGCTVPQFVWTMLTRETSRTVELLFTNHVNCIGDTTRLQQTEMFLLGHTLGLCIQVAHPSSCESGPLVSHYPDEGGDTYNKVLIIEDEPGRYSLMVDE